MKIYLLVRHSSVKSDNGILLATTNGRHAFQVYRDEVHRLAYGFWGKHYPWLLLSEKSNGYRTFTGIAQWVESAQTERFAQWFDAITGAVHRMDLKQVEVCMASTGAIQPIGVS